MLNLTFCQTQDSSGLGALAISGIVVGSVSVGMAVISIGGLLLIGAAIVWRKVRTYLIDHLVCPPVSQSVFRLISH